MNYMDSATILKDSSKIRVVLSLVVKLGHHILRVL